MIVKAIMEHARKVRASMERFSESEGHHGAC